MLITETVTIRGTDYAHAYSDAAMYIEQVETGALYADAIDVLPCPFTYTETNEPIEDTTATDPYAEAGRILMGDDA